MLLYGLYTPPSMFKFRHFKLVFAAIALVTANILCAQANGAGGDFMALQNRMAELFQENASAIVRVKAAYKPDRADEKPEVVIGTGFFISKEGHILTNASIAFDPDRLWIEHQNIAYAAKVVGADLSANLSLLKLDTLPEQFNFLHLPDTPGLPPVGTLLLRISAPLDFNPSPAMGMVAGYESKFGQHYFPCNYIRTTIPAGPGDGGAAYLDLSGRLVGIQVGSLPDIGSSYLLPARAALRVRDDLLFYGKVTYGWIGFEVREDRSVAKGNRVLLSLVMPGTPAESAGMLPGDVIEQIGDYPVRTLDDLRNAMFYNRVGQYTRVRLLREGKLVEANVKLSARPQNEPLEVTTVSEFTTEDAIKPQPKEEVPLVPNTEPPKPEDEKAIISQDGPPMP